MHVIERLTTIQIFFAETVQVQALDTSREPPIPAPVACVITRSLEVCPHVKRGLISTFADARYMYLKPSVSLRTSLARDTSRLFVPHSCQRKPLKTHRPTHPAPTRTSGFLLTALSELLRGITPSQTLHRPAESSDRVLT